MADSEQMMRAALVMREAADTFARNCDFQPQINQLQQMIYELQAVMDKFDAFTKRFNDSVERLILDGPKV